VTVMYVIFLLFLSFSLSLSKFIFTHFGCYAIHP
jgi:hypothetical protein